MSSNIKYDTPGYVEEIRQGKFSLDDAVNRILMECNIVSAK